MRCRLTKAVMTSMYRRRLVVTHIRKLYRVRNIVHYSEVVGHYSEVVRILNITCRL